MSETGLTLGSLFDGIGGFPFAATIAGIKPIWAAEIDPACVAVTRQHFPDMLHYGDVSKINGAEIPPVDIITFGSPCQDLSIAGNRAGLAGARSGLFSEAIRIIYEMREATNGKYPTYIVWENVPGAFSSNKGRDFRTVLKEITKTDIPMPASGKWAAAGVVRGKSICAAWRQLDAQYWGVPQRRKRIYLIGSFGSNSAEEILFERDSVRRYLTPCGREGKRTPADTERSVAVCYGICSQNSNSMKSDNPHSGIYEADTARTLDCNGGNPCCNQGGVVICEKLCEVYDARGNGNGDIAPTITGDHNSRITDYSAVILQSAGFCGKASKGAGSVGFENEVSATLRAGQEMHVIYALDRASFNQGENAKYNFEVSDKGINSTLVSQGPSAVCYAIQGNCIDRADTAGCNGIGCKENISYTLNTVDRHAVVYKFIKWIVRRLTPLECERLQGYPNVAELEISEMDKDELIAFNIANGMIGVDCENGKVYKTRTSGGRLLAKPQEYAENIVNEYETISIRNGKTRHQYKKHRVIWIAKNGVIPNGYCVDHIDGNKRNNKISNLQLLTFSENSNKAKEDGLYLSGDKHPSTKISQNKKSELVTLYYTRDYTMRQLSELYGISKSRVGQIIKFCDWTELPKIKDMTDDEYTFFLRAFMLDKAIKGKEQKKPPTKASLVKWYNKLDCDGNRYKMCGNSLAIPCALRVLGGIADYILKERER